MIAIVHCPYCSFKQSVPSKSGAKINVVNCSGCGRRFEARRLAHGIMVLPLKKQTL